MTGTDWTAWHDAYARPGSGLANRLAAVRHHIARRLDDTAPDDDTWSVGVNRLVAAPQPLEHGSHWFTFDRG